MLAKRKKSRVNFNLDFQSPDATADDTSQSSRTYHKNHARAANSLTEASNLYTDSPIGSDLRVKNTSNVYPHRIHSLLYPPPPSEIAAFSYRIPKLTQRLNLPAGDYVKVVRWEVFGLRFLTRNLKRGCKNIDWKKAIFRNGSLLVHQLDNPIGQNRCPYPESCSNYRSRSNLWTLMVTMHPFGSEEEEPELRARNRPESIQMSILLDLESNWIDNYPKFTNFLDDGKLKNEQS
ncbi:hypothetical protein Pst134EA_002795 [Puccinia striiformis f. sp. tritici]|uniref:hypothetical protein n=1 Tax=Puccinia striiformis f. sp. tritici TaxID=168172 RepID=UPI002007ED40|nr:hypothetical protein Pst134EA_002795 [Puccinia striiformis f. sp. tritici]KAH9472170.1 hypothetical protein Pst134EA_002795 [Puccinia striiformis f. sp. tritici]